MKKFIPLVTAVAVLLSALSCRETEELVSVPEATYEMAAKTAAAKKDSLEMNTEVSLVSGIDKPDDEKDPPKKDDAEW